MLSMYCTASMLPCGRYYYEPERGYVGNPWVKFSYQYCYIYLGWLLHHLDIIEHFGFRFAQNFNRNCVKLYNSASKNYYNTTTPYITNSKQSAHLMFTSEYSNYYTDRAAKSHKVTVRLNARRPLRDSIASIWA